MTPRIERATFKVGDRVQDKRSGFGLVAGRGTVVAVYPDACRVRWDRGGNEGLRAIQFLEPMEEIIDA